MKSPADIIARLRRQWQSPQKREARLLHGPLSWPLHEPIGKPKPQTLISNLDAVIEHNRRWKGVSVGQVQWQEVSYRATAQPVSVPVSWQLNKPSEWIDACQDKAIRDEFTLMAALVESTNPVFHTLFIRRRSLWQQKNRDEIIQACRLASELTPGCAKGKPLRALPVAGIDTKFFERNARLISSLLDCRYEGEASRRGLEAFLDALPEGEHWVLLIDMDGQLLPFKKQRLSTSELTNTSLPGTHLLIVENESCQHQLPPYLPNTLVILGAGFDLDWTANPQLQQKNIAYWGDIDTWGLSCLAKARKKLPHLQALLMTAEVFTTSNSAAVPEPVVAGTGIPEELNQQERDLYGYLLDCEKGRLEQEYLPAAQVHAVIGDWHKKGQS